MKYSFLTLLLLTLSSNNLLKPMLGKKEFQKEIQDEFKEHPDSGHKYGVLTQCLHELVMKNLHDTELLPSSLSIFFDRKTINSVVIRPTGDERSREVLPIVALSRDGSLLNEALYKLSCDMDSLFTPRQLRAMNCTKIEMSLIPMIAYMLNREELVRVINPIITPINFSTILFIRIKGENFLGVDKTMNLSASEFFLHINNLEPHSKHLKNAFLTQKEKVKYWKESFKPVFHIEAVWKRAISRYYKQLVTLYGCFNVLRNTKKIIMPKNIINHHIAPHIRPKIFTAQCNTIYNEVQDQVRHPHIRLSKEEQIFFYTKFEPWFTKKTNALITFDNVKKVIKYYNNSLK